jgi:hypothetical protein
MKHSFLLLFVLFFLCGRSQQSLKIDYSIPSNWALTPDNYPASFQKMKQGKAAFSDVLIPDEMLSQIKSDPEMLKKLQSNLKMK